MSLQREHPKTLYFLLCLWSAITLILATQTNAQNLPSFDFRNGNGVGEWVAQHDLAAIQSSPEGMVLLPTGEDPYLSGPARAYPANQPLWLRIRLKTTQSGMGQVFYFTRAKGTNEADSVRFPVPSGKWQEIKVPLPALEAETFLRLDPPGAKGSQTVVERIWVEPRTILTPPEFPKFVAPALQNDALSLRSGKLELRHSRTQFGAFELSYEGVKMAVGVSRNLVGYLQNGKPHWVNLSEIGKTEAVLEKEALNVVLRFSDSEGAEWRIVQQFTPNPKGDAIEATIETTVSQPRHVIYLPQIALSAGVGSFGTKKEHALFSGLEYLDGEEPSSSEADIIGLGSRRQVPDNKKICLPLMAVQAQGRYVGLMWYRDDRFSAVFDSPDRLFHSGGHLMGLIFPGSDGGNREEGSLLPYDSTLLAPIADLGKPIALSRTLHATLIGGKGESVVPAVRQYVALRGIPEPPRRSVSLPTYIKTAAAGWLDSKIFADGKFRHAFGGGTFAPLVAADAPVFMEWLATQTKDLNLAKRLQEAAKYAWAQVPQNERTFAGVSHVRYPVAPLLYGNAAEAAEHAEQRGAGLRTRFEPDGSVRYYKSPEGLDYGKTHFAPDANGHSADPVMHLLTCALLTGDPELKREGIRVLRALDKFTHSAPRGAQTWEVPLHTPDILGSAYLVNAYLRGYELTGEAHFLEQAKYWAWTGVPFIYLTVPTPQPIGLYATIPVLGATQWIAPNWMGLPVQWCGLVYSDALYRLARYDTTAPWHQIAEGITLSGIQQTWPLESDPERQGLLPDSLNLAVQIRNDAAINPGTVQANAIRLFKDRNGNPQEIYDYHVFREQGVIVHAPGRITLGDSKNRAAKPASETLRFSVSQWAGRRYQILVVGLKRTPKVRISGAEVSLNKHLYNPEKGRLVLNVEGEPDIEIMP
jgi:hypothetical protein